MTRRTNGKLSRKVYDQVIQGLLIGKYRAGMPIRELELVDELGISRTPVREGLKKLEEEGIVTDVPFKGKSITNLSYQDVIDIYEVREVLEGLAARLATNSIDDDLLKQLEECNQACSIAKKDSLIGEYISANDTFHSLILRSAGNKQLMRMMGNITKINRLLIRATTRFPGSMARGVEEHHQIIGAIKRRDSAAVETLVRQHIVCSKQEYIDFYQIDDSKLLKELLDI